MTILLSYLKIVVFDVFEQSMRHQLLGKWVKQKNKNLRKKEDLVETHSRLHSVALFFKFDFRLFKF